MIYPEKPLLSLCIPSYKKADWLEATLRLTLQQVAPFKGRVEVVVSDDASPDHSASVLKTLKTLYPDTLYYEIQPQNLKNNKNYVAALKQARGDFVWLLGNDDFLRPGAIEKVLSILKQYTELNFIYTSYTFFKPGSGLPDAQYLENIPFEADDFPPCSYGQHVMEEFYLKSLVDIPAYDALCFTPMYGGVVRRELWLKAFEFNAKGDFFRELAGSFGYAEYLVREALHQPTYYIGYPYVAASQDITWGSFAASACLRNMPVLYDLLEKEGVDKKALRFIRDDYLKLIKTSIPYVLEYRQLYYHDEFSFWDHTRRFWLYWQYWKNLGYIIPKHLRYLLSVGFLGPYAKKYMPSGVYNLLKNVKNLF